MKIMTECAVRSKPGLAMVDGERTIIIPLMTGYAFARGPLKSEVPVAGHAGR